MQNFCRALIDAVTPTPEEQDYNEYLSRGTWQVQHYQPARRESQPSQVSFWSSGSSETATQYQPPSRVNLQGYNRPGTAKAKPYTPILKLHQLTG